MLSQKELECIQACNECALASLHCVTANLIEDGTHNINGCISEDMECANICKLLSKSIAHGDMDMLEVCELCAEICEKCASECGKYRVNHLQSCSEACVRCAAKCRALMHSTEKMPH